MLKIAMEQWREQGGVRWPVWEEVLLDPEFLYLFREGKSLPEVKPWRRNLSIRHRLLQVKQILPAYCGEKPHLFKNTQWAQHGNSREATGIQVHLATWFIYKLSNCNVKDYEGRYWFTCPGTYILSTVDSVRSSKPWDYLWSWGWTAGGVTWRGSSTRSTPNYINCRSQGLFTLFPSTVYKRSGQKGLQQSDEAV